MALTVDVVSAEQTWWSGEAASISAPAADGSIGVLPGHQPILAVLRPGLITVRPESGQNVEMQVTGGFISVDHDAVTIVVDPSTESLPTAG